MMKLSTILSVAALALAISAPVQGALDRIEEAYELDLTQVTLPIHNADRVIVRACDTCEPVFHSVDASTTYHIDSRENVVSLTELREAAASVSVPRETLVYVMYSTESGVVTRITLRLAGR